MRVGPSVDGKTELFFFLSWGHIITVSIVTLGLLLIRSAIAEMPNLLLCEMTH